MSLLQKGDLKVTVQKSRATFLFEALRNKLEDILKCFVLFVG